MLTYSCPSTASCTMDKLRSILVTDATKHLVTPLCNIVVANKNQQQMSTAMGLQHDNQGVLTTKYQHQYQHALDNKSGDRTEHQ